MEDAEVPDPKPKANEVLVRVRSVALNRLDLWVRTGWKGLKLPMPHILGSDIAGTVVGLGAEVSDVTVGEDVVLGPGVGCGTCNTCLRGADNRCPRYHILGETTTGGYAELIAVPRRNVFKKPANLGFREAACLPLVFTTAWGMLVERLRLQATDQVLVMAAGSGVGSAAIQIAKRFGATVYATASSAEKLERARQLGADHLINYSTQDFAAEIYRLTDKRGVDVVFEHTGGDTFDKSIRSLAIGGTLITCGATSRPTAEIDIRRLFAKHLSLIGHTMGSLAAMEPILREAAAGRFVPIFDRAFPLSAEGARAAQSVLLGRSQFGKVVLEPQ